MFDFFYNLRRRIDLWLNPSELLPGHSMFACYWINKEQGILAGTITVQYARSINSRPVREKTFDFLKGPDGLIVFGSPFGSEHFNITKALKERL